MVRHFQYFGAQIQRAAEFAVDIGIEALDRPRAVRLPLQARLHKDAAARVVQRCKTDAIDIVRKRLLERKANVVCTVHTVRHLRYSPAVAAEMTTEQIGRESCRESVCKEV